jgi:glycosyltransferase involved in cell wall biosynthesis
MLFLCSNPVVEASMRFRVMQFFEPLARAGHFPVLSTFFRQERSRFMSRVAHGLATRVRDLVRSRGVDRIFIHREIMPYAWNDLVRLLPGNVPMIFDLDDAVFMATHPGWAGYVARPATTRLLVQRAELVYAGNEYLADYASQWSRHVRVVPTVVDTGVFCPRETRPPRGRPLVGWVGSPGTTKYLSAVTAALDDIGRTIPFDLRLVGANRDFGLKHVNVEYVPWRLEDDVRAFQELDIGLYPLEDDVWTRGKCGFKAIQYMACGVPFIASPVGVVRNIVREGVDGLWARTESEWRGALETLLRDAAMRARLAKAGRARAIERYSVQALAPSWIEGLESPRKGSAGQIDARVS